MPNDRTSTYTVVWPRAAQKMLARLPPEMQERIIDQVESIAEEPFAHVRKVEGSPYHRLRVGDYQVVMQITASHLIIYVVRVAPRKDAYRGLSSMSPGRPTVTAAGTPRARPVTGTPAEERLRAASGGRGNPCHASGDMDGGCCGVSR